MNRDRAKELLPIFQAFAEGKEIECRMKGNKSWELISHSNWLDSHDYRIKPEPKYRPFEDVDECLQEMQKHNPFGWLINKNSRDHSNMGSIYNDGNYNLRICGSYYNFKVAFDTFTFMDGTPFGIKMQN